MNRIKRNIVIKKCIAWILGVGCYLGIFKFQSIFMEPRIKDVLFVFIVFVLSWSIRGIYQENKDTMLAGMGEIELETMKAQIEQVLKNRRVAINVRNE